MTAPQAIPRSIRFVPLLCLLAALLSGGARAASVDQLMDASGIRHALNHVAASISASMDTPQPGMNLPEDIRRGLKDAAAEAFRPAPMIDTVRTKLGRDLNSQQIADTMRWLDAPLGRRITALENKAAEPAAMRGLEAYAKELQSRPPSQLRRRLVQDLNAATGSVEIVTSMIEATALAVALGMNAGQPKQAQIPPALLQEKLRAALPDMRAQAESILTLSALYTYRGLPDAELSDYLRFLQSSSGAAYSRATATAVQEAMTQAIGRFMVTIPKSLERTRGGTRT